MMPTYFLALWEVDGDKNLKILESLLKDFFKMMVSEPVDFETIHVSKIYEKSLLPLYAARNLYLYGPGYFEEKLELYLPVDSHLVSEKRLSETTEKWIDLLVFKILKKTE